MQTDEPAVACDPLPATRDLMQEPRSFEFSGPWLALCFAFTLHIADEALTGFLGVYNPTVTAVRQRWSWFPMPTFELREWLAGLILGCVIMFSLTPLASPGSRSLRPLAWFYAAIMLLNGFGHTLFTILGRFRSFLGSGTWLLFLAILAGSVSVDVRAAVGNEKKNKSWVLGYCLDRRLRTADRGPKA